MRDTRPWWLWQLAVGGLSLLVVLLTPSGAVRSTFQLLISLTVIPAVITGIRVHRPAHRFGWRALALAVTIAVVSNVAWPVLQATHVLAFSGAADLLYYLTFPALAFALATLPGLPRGTRSAGFTEAGIITSGAAVVWWTLLVDPLVHGGAVGPAHIVVFPLLDMALLALAFRLLLLTDAGSVSYLLLTVSCASLLTADTAMFLDVGVVSFVSATNTMSPPLLSQVCWLITNVTMGAAALHPSMARPVEPPSDTALADRIGASRIYVATVVATPILSGVFLLNEIASGDLSDADVVVPVGATAVTAALVVTRMRQLNVLVRQRAGALEQLQRELLHRAQNDDMTGLPNRTVLHDRLTSMLRHQSPGSLMVLDLDEFKEVNDRFGYAMGDDLLVAVAERLRRLLDGRALVVRLGSDEFGVLLPGSSTDAVAAGAGVLQSCSSVEAVAAGAGVLQSCSSAEAVAGAAGVLQSCSSAEAVAGEILVAMRRPVNAQGHELFATASVGLRTVDPDLLTGDVLRDAYLALHAAKAAGRDQVKVFDRRMREQRLAVAETVERLRGAIVRDELVVYYQPLIRLADERMVGVEALLRWKPPGDRMVPPDEFIPLAEDSGLIVPIGEWVLREACRVVASWTDAVVSVNVSPRQLREHDFGAKVLDALRSSGLPPSALILEITEGVLVASGQVTEQAIGHLSMLRSRGVRVAIDDFGTGYSSLAYLRDLPIDHIKIDRSFMPASSEPADLAAGTLVKAIIDLAGGLGLGTIAEGVETAEQVELLRSLGCERAQGFYFARPVPESEAAAMLAATASR
ncbi:putative bifunctional diguanylate cyclase/phosphodiesterase [Actinoplanes sp. NPDC049265]|uniref:putative bifunctional diguanylate cyclase/phosphodiesterase n=1 Tax=Actinoplanes sp. NPDC049265 TaxID=3363902 RepID=UPI00371E6F24